MGLIITACTTDYSKHALHLQQSGVEHGHPVYIYPYEDQGSWIMNCREKPRMILKAMLAHFREDAVMWCDADSEIRAECHDRFEDFLGSEHDILLPTKVGWSKNRRFYNATALFKQNLRVYHFLLSWQRIARELGEVSDEWAMEMTIRYFEEKDFDLSIGVLPAAYSWITNIHGRPKNRAKIIMGISGEASKYIKELREGGKGDQHDATL